MGAATASRVCDRELKRRKTEVLVDPAVHEEQLKEAEAAAQAAAEAAKANLEAAAAAAEDAKVMRRQAILSAKWARVQTRKAQAEAVIQEANTSALESKVKYYDKVTGIVGKALKFLALVALAVAATACCRVNKLVSNRSSMEAAKDCVPTSGRKEPLAVQGDSYTPSTRRH